MAYDYNTGKVLDSKQSQSLYNTNTGQQLGNSSGTNILPADLSAFQKANPRMDFNRQDLQQYNAAIPVPNASPIQPTIKAENLGLQSPMVLPTIPSNTAATGIIASAASQAGQSKQQIDQATQTANDLQASQGPSEADKAQQEIMTRARAALGMENQVNQEQAKAEAAQVNPQQDYLNNINTQIANETVAHRAESANLGNTPMTQAQAIAAHRAVDNEYGYRLANLAIQQSAAQQNISAIQSNFDRQTKLLIQPYENELKFQETFAQKYADSLSSKENKKLDLVINERKDLIQQTKELQAAKAQMITEVTKNGGGADQATQQAILNATDIASVAKAGGQYVGALDFMKAQADLAQTKATTAHIKAETAKMTADQQAVPGFTPSGLGADVDKANLSDYQTAKGAYGEIEALTAKYGGTPSNFTVEMADKMPDVEVEAMGKALARLISPDITRIGGDPGNAFAPTSLAEKGTQLGRALLGGKQYLPNKIVEGVNTAATLLTKREQVLGLKTPANPLGLTTPKATSGIDPLGINQPH